MNSNQDTFIIHLKVQTIIVNIKKYFNITYREALKLLYHSKLYKALENEKAKMWYYSSNDLFKMFLEEKTKGNYTCMEDNNG